MGRHVKTQDDLIRSTLTDLTKAIEAHLAARAGDEPAPLVGDWMLSVGASAPTESDPLGVPILVVLTPEVVTHERAFQLSVGAASMTRRAALEQHICGPECA